MVRDVSQAIVPNIVTHLVVIRRGQLILLLKKESAHCNLMPLGKALKGLSLLGENCGDSVAKVLRKCCERVTKHHGVLRK